MRSWPSGRKEPRGGWCSGGIQWTVTFLARSILSNQKKNYNTNAIIVFSARFSVARLMIPVTNPTVLSVYCHHRIVWVFTFYCHWIVSVSFNCILYQISCLCILSTAVFLCVWFFRSVRSARCNLFGEELCIWPPPKGWLRWSSGNWRCSEDSCFNITSWAKSIYVIKFNSLETKAVVSTKHWSYNKHYFISPLRQNKTFSWSSNQIFSFVWAAR